MGKKFPSPIDGENVLKQVNANKQFLNFFCITASGGRRELGGQRPHEHYLTMEFFKSAIPSECLQSLYLLAAVAH